ncbi:MAG: AAA family ATPase [Chitinophagaceae bacterium]
MIFVDRNTISRPEVFYSREIEIAQKRLEEFYDRSKESRSQEKYSIPFEPELRDKFLRALREVFNGKCAYCESIIPLEVTKSVYDHFRPKSGARGFDKEFSTDHYWWLTYEWNNLYYCCPNCNQFKSTWFPIEGERSPINMPYNDIISFEKALLVDPCVDQPEEHLTFNEQGEVDFLSSKGKATIEIIKLNRSELVEARRRTIHELKNEWERFNALFSSPDENMVAINELAKSWGYIFSNESTKPYLAIQRQILTKLFKDAGIGDYLSNREFKIFQESEILKGVALKFSQEEADKFANKIELSFKDKEKINQSLNLDKIKHVYVESIEIENFKCFSYLKLDFENRNDVSENISELRLNEPWLLFLGENGVGKSSLLKAFVIGLTGKEYIDDLGITGKDILKHGARKGFIRIKLVGAVQPIEVSFNRREIKTTLYQPIVNIVAYNSIRLKPKAGKIEPEKAVFYGAKARNLFDYTFSLIDADTWLVKLLKKDKTAFDRVAIALKDLMLLDNEDTIKIEKGLPVVKRGNDQFFIDELSDGYKSVFYLAVDIMATLAGENVTFDLAEGMVLIDEIGTHLHPRWRMEVVGRLRKAFPKIRFVVTTHEPLCLRGLYAGETVVLTKNQEREVIALTDLPDPSELRVDQILTSDFFGLKSTIDLETERLFDEYYIILALEEQDRSEEQKDRLLELSQIIPRIKHLGDTEREELTYYVIDELLARKTREDGLKIKEELKMEALKRVASIWKTLDVKNNSL